MKKMLMALTLILLLTFALTACFHEHEIVTDAAKAPTCTRSGLTEGSHCATCGEVLVFQTKIEARGHTVEIDAAVPATCIQSGLTEGKHCSVCGECLLEQTTVNAKGHNFKNEKCQTCGKKLMSTITIEYDSVMYSSYWLNILGQYQRYNPRFTIANPSASLKQNSENGKIYINAEYNCKILYDNQAVKNLATSTLRASYTLWGDGKVIKRGMVKISDAYQFIGETYKTSFWLEVPYADAYKLVLSSYDD